MDQYSSAEELIKARKPYTITKQRERWTEEEHNRFLEALKLYGRAWQRIEEHIGTKTAVQIRSHAQKFFTKLEKEALSKGVPIGKSLDIEIPPPRPKRKPSNPYPRKMMTSVGPDKEEKLPLVSSLCKEMPMPMLMLDLEKEPLPEKSNYPEESEDQNNNAPPPQSDNFSTFREFIPTLTLTLRDETSKSIVTADHHKLESENTKLLEDKRSIENDMKTATEIYPSVPVPIDGTSNMTSDISYQESGLHQIGSGIQLFGYPSSSSSEHQSHVPNFHPLFTPPTHNNQDNYRAFIHTSPTFPSLIVSALLQNPAAHAAASFAATFFPTDSNASATSSPPSVAAIAAATVAAATSWWAAHGLIPVCAPAFTCSPMDITTQPRDIDAPNTALQDQQNNPSLSTSDSEECEDATKLLNTDQVIAPVNDLANLKTRKLVDRSSCGSNTPSSSEVEADALEKHENQTEELLKEHDINRPPTDPTNRRARSFTNTNDSWKAVSEEGRMAFRALFSREVLPQSFSPPQDWKIMGKNIDVESNINIFQSNLIGKTCGSFSSYPVLADNTSLTSENTIFGVGTVKLKPRQTGFKPYKRCSVEVSKIASISIQDEEKSPKRIRVEGETST